MFRKQFDLTNRNEKLMTEFEIRPPVSRLRFPNSLEESMEESVFKTLDVNMVC